MALNAALEVPTDLRFGNLTVTQDNRTISRLELPSKDQAEMVIPLAGAQVFGNRANVTPTMTALPLEGYCWDPLSPIRLVNGSVTFAGTELAPTTVAAFLPPVIRKLTIALPATPSQPESDAAVQLAAAMEMRYSGQNPDVVVVPSPMARPRWRARPYPYNGRSSSGSTKLAQAFEVGPLGWSAGCVGDGADAAHRSRRPRRRDAQLPGSLSTRRLPVSTTYTAPVSSTATPSGDLSPVNGSTVWVLSPAASATTRLLEESVR